MLVADAVNKSNSGHPGLPMGCAPMGYALWQNILNHNPNNPKWFNRDRFVLSAGHGCMLLYSASFDRIQISSIEDIKEFRQWGSKLLDIQKHLKLKELRLLRTSWSWNFKCSWLSNS